MKRRWIICLLALWLCVGAGRAEMWITQEEFDRDYAPYCRLEGDTLTLLEGVVTLGSYQGEALDDDWEYVVSDPAIAALFEDHPSMWLSAEIFSFSRLVWPASIRALGAEAIHAETLDQLTLPAQLEKLCPDALIYCSIGTLRIECALPWTQIQSALCDCRVRAYEVPEDHPLYRVIDGALFTKDGKTLLAYPNAREDGHWDVPAGVERIGKNAFANENLRTLSLPIGLTAVEDYAFSGCTRLQALSLPLTVREMGSHLFDNCVSLELLSLPQGMQAEKGNSTWAIYYADDGLFRGDNGDTLTQPRPDSEEGSFWMDAVGLLTPGDVPLYADPLLDRPTGQAAGGQFVYAVLVDGRCEISTAFGKKAGWTDLAFFQPLAPTVLFDYAAIEPPAEGEVWKYALPGHRGSVTLRAEEVTWEDSFARVFGPFVVFSEDGEQAAFACRIQDARLWREASRADVPMGIVFWDQLEQPLPLRSAPEGEITCTLYGGTQVKVLEERDGFLRVSTGLEEGWLPQAQVKIVPVLQETEGE